MADEVLEELALKNYAGSFLDISSSRITRVLLSSTQCNISNNAIF